MSRQVVLAGSAAAADFASAGEVLGATAIVSPGWRRRSCSVRRRASAPVMAAASSAPAPNTERSIISGLSSDAEAGVPGAVSVGEG
ncbi:hypothetical protein [Streptomyces rishiriensis]|uniref:Uncharacterized protein n=1 Tax=Streptomyces rishiriensis TaxID=68264 RepID=A0ABU0NI46_STRRH|nr:hypothetical protein [Streptomyces rishiriensis]MDQ0578245.1 hypothetical protein [Streptomyces rishiriensis]